MEITAGMVKELRERTGAGMMQCKKALAESSGDVDKAVEILRKMGLAGVAKRAERVTAQGRIESYIHAGNQIGVLVEVNCETDFVARTDEFIKLCHEVALQIAATSPNWIKLDEVPPEAVEDHIREARTLLVQQTISGDDLEKRLEKERSRFIEEKVLLQQPNIRDGSKTIGEMIDEFAAKVGENMRIARFCYFRLGGNS
jgi:elongation factor Ts